MEQRWQDRTSSFDRRRRRWIEPRSHDRNAVTRLPRSSTTRIRPIPRLHSAYDSLSLSLSCINSLVHHRSVLLLHPSFHASRPRFRFIFFPLFSPFLFAKNGEGTSCGNIIADRRFRRGCTRIVNNAREVGTAGNRLTFAMKERERERASSRRGARRGSGGVSEDIQSMISGLPVVA